MDRKDRINTKVEVLEFIENLGTGSVYYPISQELRDRGITWWFITPLEGNVQDASLVSQYNRNGALVQLDYQWGKLSYWNGIEKGMAEMGLIHHDLNYSSIRMETNISPVNLPMARKSGVKP